MKRMEKAMLDELVCQLQFKYFIFQCYDDGVPNTILFTFTTREEFICFSLNFPISSQYGQ